MLDLLGRLHEHASELAKKLDSEEAGGELIRAVLGFGRTVVRFVMTVSAATRAGTSVKPAIEQLIADAPEAAQTVSAAMPALGDLLFDPQTWETSVLEISESDRWRETTELAMSLIDRVLEESVDILLGESDREWPIAATFVQLESALDEVIDTYLAPLLGGR